MFIRCGRFGQFLLLNHSACVNKSPLRSGLVFRFLDQIQISTIELDKFLPINRSILITKFCQKLSSKRIYYLSLKLQKLFVVLFGLISQWFNNIYIELLITTYEIPKILALIYSEQTICSRIECSIA